MRQAAAQAVAPVLERLEHLRHFGVLDRSAARI
jgi:hypothetical protein